MIIADTGFFLALANRADDDHEIAVAALESLDEGLITTWPVVTETTHLLAPSPRKETSAGTGLNASRSPGHRAASRQHYATAVPLTRNSSA